jgi:hypothetical protein
VSRFPEKHSTQKPPFQHIEGFYKKNLGVRIQNQEKK